jgi:serine/threonine protein kinase
MEGYTLWWNGGSLQRFWDKYNNKLSKALDYDDIIKDTESGLTWEELMMVTTYRRNRVNLALSLLVIMDKCHQQDTIHNDLSLANVLLHFDSSTANTM